MPETSNEQVVHRYLAAHKAHDYDTVGRLRHPDWTVEWPQSGERVRGDANDRAIMDSWPGGLPQAGDIRVVGAEDRWVVTPALTMVRVVGSGDFVVDRWHGDVSGRLRVARGRPPRAPRRPRSARDLVLRTAARGAWLAGAVGRADRRFMTESGGSVR